MGSLRIWEIVEKFHDRDCLQIWRLPFVECSASHNWRVVALFQEVVSAAELHRSTGGGGQGGAAGAAGGAGSGNNGCKRVRDRRKSEIAEDNTQCENCFILIDLFFVSPKSSRLFGKLTIFELNNNVRLANEFYNQMSQYL